jgi:hypothetical protein
MAQIEETIITPEIAEKLLGTNVHNRKVSKSHVDFLAKEMSEGRWALNGETIKISKDGNLLDGQNRLLACIKSKVPIRCFILKDIEESAFSTIDTGRNRTAGDVLSIYGFKQWNNVAALAKAIIGYNQGFRTFNTKIGGNSSGSISHVGNKSRKVSNQYVLDFCTKNDLYEYILKGENCYRTAKLLSPTEYGLMYYLTSHISKDDADVFMDKLASGAGLVSGDPVLALRNKLIENMGLNLKFTGKARMILIFKTWNYMRRRQSVKVLRWTNEEEVPELI